MMRIRPVLPALAATFLLSSPSLAEKRKDDVRLLGSVEQFVSSTVEQLAQIPADRQRELALLTEQAAAVLNDSGQLDLVFICTHNSRRSQMAQVWAQVAATYYQVPGIVTYSGGTEATACNERTVRALQSSGLNVTTRRKGENPVYRVRFAGGLPPLELYSKVYHDQALVLKDYFAVIVCGDAEEKCPVVMGTEHRHVLRYQDPKVADGTTREASTYMERNQQIAREMFYLISQISERLQTK